VAAQYWVRPDFGKSAPPQPPNDAWQQLAGGSLGLDHISSLRSIETVVAILDWLTGPSNLPA